MPALSVLKYYSSSNRGSSFLARLRGITTPLMLHLRHENTIREGVGSRDEYHPESLLPIALSLQELVIDATPNKVLALTKIGLVNLASTNRIKIRHYYYYNDDDLRMIFTFIVPCFPHLL